MGLIDLKTDLKSLKYGKDTIGGGYSGQPYIQSPIPDGFNNLGANQDFILRGGINAIGDAATDIKRLTKMFFDLKSPNGLLFIAKQNLLSQTAVRTQTTDGANEGIYSPLNTLAQAGVVELGGHLNKQGVNPFTETGAYANNIALYSVKVKPSQQTEDNRLARLYQLVTTNSADKLDGFILNNGNVLTYEGGPNSILGAGKTNIRYASFRTGKQNSQYVSNPDFFTGKNNQKSIDADDKQVGGLKINPNKSWTKSPQYGLPDFNINSPQSSSFSQANDGQYNVTSTIAKQNISGSKDGGKYDLYNPLFYAGISANESIYNTLLGVYEVESQKRNSNGSPNWYNNVYKPGTLNEYKENTGILTWTAKTDTTKYNPTQGDNVSNAFRRSFITQNLDIFPLNDFPDGLTRNNESNKVYKTENTTQGKRYLIPYQTPPNPNSEVNPSSPYANGTITYNQEDLITANPSRYSPAIKEDFRKILRQKNPNTAGDYADLGQLTDAPGYIDNNVGEKTQIGNPGQRKTKSYASYTKGVSYSGEIKALDKINASPIGTGVNALDGGSNNDLVTFNITPFGGSETMNFRAFLGSFSDNYSSKINAQQYVGRGEEFYTYTGFTRKISLSWTVAALSKQELIPMYKKLSYLASNTAPVYKDGFMQGPLVTLTVGGYINEMPGYIDGLTLEMGEDSTWEIGIDDIGKRDLTVAQLTHIIKVSGFSFTPIPTYLPQRGAHFIDLWNGSGKLWSDNEVSLT
jgi:hypothetical protein